MKSPKPQPGFESLLEKAKGFCAYRERSVREVRMKIKTWGAPYSLEQRLVKALEEDNFLNDARFAKSFVRGKFRTNKWGKRKIKTALQMAGIADSLIREALLEIDSEQYTEVARSLAEKKLKALATETDTYTRKAKLFQFLMQKGFESDLISKVIAEFAAE